MERVLPLLDHQKDVQDEIEKRFKIEYDDEEHGQDGNEPKISDEITKQSAK